MSSGMLHFYDLSLDEKTKFMNDHDYFFFDIDGVLLNTTALIPRADDVLKKLHASGKTIKLVTNNCNASRKEIHSGLSSSIPFLQKEDIISSSFLAAKYFEKNLGNKKLYVSGDKGVFEELEELKLDYITSQNKKITSWSDMIEMKLDKDVGAVLLASDMDFHFSKLLHLVNYLRDPQIAYIQTYEDTFVRLECNMQLFPGVGAIAAAVEAVTGRKATNVGKPSEFARAYIRSQIPLEKKAVFVGDTLDADIVMGNLCNMSTILVLTGASSLKDAKKAEEAEKCLLVPNFYANSIADLID